MTGEGQETRNETNYAVKVSSGWRRENTTREEGKRGMMRGS